MRTMQTFIAMSLFGLFGCFRGVKAPETPAAAQPGQSFHALSAVDIHGNPFDFAALKGHKVVVVNTASECGYTPQYKELQALYDRYREQGLVVIGFPCNQFGGQEPGTEAQIEAFCQRNYGVTFPMMSKVDVKGSAQHPVYQWLTRKDLNGALDSGVKWNFHKFLVDEQGRLAMSLESAVSPLDERMTHWVDGR
jgi:glutathione peroxidase